MAVQLHMRATTPPTHDSSCKVGDHSSHLILRMDVGGDRSYGLCLHSWQQWAEAEQLDGQQHFGMEIPAAPPSHHLAALETAP